MITSLVRQEFKTITVYEQKLSVKITGPATECLCILLEAPRIQTITSRLTLLV